MADSNKQQLAYLRETTWGAAVSSAMNIIPWVSGSMTAGVESVRSSTIRSDAQLADSIHTGESPSGSFDFEMVADTYDDFLRSAIRSDADWSTAGGATGAGTSVVSGSKIQLSNVHSNTVIGQWVYVSGFNQSTTNGWKKVVDNTTNNEISVSPAIQTAESGTSGCTVSGSYIKNGTTSGSYQFAQYYSDLGDSGGAKYKHLSGARLNSTTLSMSPNGIPSLNIGFDGKDLSQASAWFGNGSASNVAEKTVYAETTAFNGLFISDDAGTAKAYAEVSEDVLENTISIGTNNRTQKGLGSLTRTGLAQDAVAPSGSIQFYVNDATWLYEGDLLAMTPLSMAFALNLGTSSGTTDRYLIEFPKIRFTSEPGNNGGVDTDLVYSFDWAGEAGGVWNATSATTTGSTDYTCVISKV